MTEQDLHQIIEEQAAEQKALMFQKYQQEAEQCIIDCAHSRKKRKLNAIRWGSCIAAFALIVICVSVVLPLTLTDENVVHRYYYTDLRLTSCDYDIKAYSHNNDNKILYPDWYDYKTHDRLAYSPNDADKIVYMQEETTLSAGEIKATLCVMKKNIQVDIFDDYDEPHFSLTLNNGVAVNYNILKNTIKLKFEYDGYKYYFDFTNTTNINDVTPLLESMF